MKPIRRLTALVLAASLIGAGGCAMFVVGAGAGAGAVAYAKGKLGSTETAKLAEVWDATRKAVEELDYVVIETNRQAASAVLIARSPRDERLEITMKSTTDKTTELGIRVGALGNEERAQLVLDRIRRHLKD
jgi:hypothetical protein